MPFSLPSDNWLDGVGAGLETLSVALFFVDVSLSASRRRSLARTLRRLGATDVGGGDELGWSWTIGITIGLTLFIGGSWFVFTAARGTGLNAMLAVLVVAGWHFLMASTVYWLARHVDHIRAEPADSNSWDEEHIETWFAVVARRKQRYDEPWFGDEDTYLSSMRDAVWAWGIILVLLLGSYLIILLDWMGDDLGRAIQTLSVIFGIGVALQFAAIITT